MESGVSTVSRRYRNRASLSTKSILALVWGVTLLLACGQESKQSGDMQTSENSIPEITVQELQQKVSANEQFFLLDVRTLPEFTEAHLNFTDDLIPYDSVPAYIERLPEDKATPIYTFCRSGRRSGIVTQYLRSIGYTNAFNISGGIIAWKAAGYETVAGQ